MQRRITLRSYRNGAISNRNNNAMSEAILNFQAEVGRLLHLMVHSVYSNKEIFLRELISNASDACDRLRYLSITRPELIADDPEFRIAVTVDKAGRRLTVADNGVGMNREDLIENLGTIARSGTAAFVEQLTGDSRKDVSLIGQFGVGFYSAFMVADKVEVLSRRAGEAQGWRWSSDGQGTFTIAEAETEGRGTRVTLHLRADAEEFLDAARLRQIIKTYSDHIAIPVRLLEAGTDADGSGEAVNEASALWTRPRSEIDDAQYREFYHHVAHAFDDPWMTLHWRAEGRIEYSALLYVPGRPPFDLFHPDRRAGVKLYVRRVFITDECKEVVPAYLRFLRGVVDSEDLPLNISREMLQHNPVLGAIRAGVVRRVLGELERKAEQEPAAYAEFWGNFGAVLKEGLYEDAAQRETLLKLARFRSTAGDGLVSLADYAARMRPGQDAIYYITGDDVEALRRSPQIEGFAARKVEVLLLADPVDEFWVPAVGAYDGKPLRSVTRGAADLSKIAQTEEEQKQKQDQAADLGPLLALFKLSLKDAVKDVRPSNRLTDSAVCLVADEGDMDLHLERLLKLHGQPVAGSKRILEINPHHPLIARLAQSLQGEQAGARAGDIAHLLLDQARILEGEVPPDPAAFARRLSRLMEEGLGG